MYVYVVRRIGQHTQDSPRWIKSAEDAWELDDVEDPGDRKQCKPCERYFIIKFTCHVRKVEIMQ